MDMFQNYMIRLWHWIRQSDLAYCAAVVLVWRLLMQVYAVFVLYRFPLTNTVAQKNFPLTIWFTFDGHHYVDIAQHGYTLMQYAFFPLYPLTIKGVEAILSLLHPHSTNLSILAGILISFFSLIGAMWFLLQLAKQYFDLETGRRSVVLLLFFPAAIFLGAVYTESFFLLWVTGSFYFAYKRNWVMAGIFGALAATTRLVGLALFPCLIIEFWLAYRTELMRHWRQGLWLLLIPVSFGLYLLYQWRMVGNPLQFLVSQQSWGRQVSANSIHQLLHELRHGLDLKHFDAGSIANLYDSLAVLFAIASAAVLALKRLWSLSLYVLLATLAPLASGTITGMIRYDLVLFPSFLLLGWWGRRQMVFSFLLAGFAIFFAVLSIHYLNGWWLA